jgi:hypothetical protein
MSKGSSALDFKISRFMRLLTGENMTKGMESRKVAATGAMLLEKELQPAGGREVVEHGKDGGKAMGAMETSQASRGLMKYVLPQQDAHIKRLTEDWTASPMPDKEAKRTSQRK